MKTIVSWIQTKVSHFLRFLKEEPRRVSAGIIAFTALSQLALSQIHIEALVRVKLTVSTPEASNFTAGMPSIGIGMFQFLFLLFGLVTIFNAIRAHSKKQQIAAVAAILITVASGFRLLSENEQSRQCRRSHRYRQKRPALDDRLSRLFRWSVLHSISTDFPQRSLTHAKAEQRPDNRRIDSHVGGRNGLFVRGVDAAWRR
ncbi:MAG: hypothetical protein MZU97_26220 [Bacillus subtilis]|nr:hypothetical protein [Bacillus subtilis]